MSVKKRYAESSAMVGKFLPKIYIRRITLEDSNFVSFDYNDSNILPRQVLTPATSVTVDWHIKDLLSEDGLGVITKTNEPDDVAKQSARQSEILEHLNIILIVAKKNANPGGIHEALSRLSAFYRTNPSNIKLRDVLRTLNQEPGIEYYDLPARPKELNFSIRNSQYQEYDINNNPINVIPGTRNIRLDNEIWDNCRDLSLIAFSYFDFESLELEGVTPEDLSRLGWFLGDISYEEITSNGQVSATSILFRDLETGQPYYGPVHSMSNSSFMTGMEHTEDSRPLTRTRVPMRKVQDFRKVQRTSLVNYQSAQFESFSGQSPFLSYMEGENKDFFEIEKIAVDLDRSSKSTDVEFSANLADIYKTNSKYYDLFKDLPQDLQVKIMTNHVKIDSIEILRRRVTRHDIGNTKLGSPKKIEFDQEQTPIHLVARSGQPYGTLSVAPIQTEDGLLREVENPEGIPNVRTATESYRSFYANDLQIRKMWDSNGVYQYGVNLRLIDGTRSFFKDIMLESRKNLTLLKRYLEEASIPIFDVRNVNRVDESTMTSMNIYDPPDYASKIESLGNYDPTTGTFSRSFVHAARENYFPGNKIRNIANNYLQIVRISFGKSFVSLSRGSSSTVRSNDRNFFAIDTDGNINRGDKVTDILSRDSVFDTDSSRDAMMNMIDPANSRPELIQSFIKSYEDVILEVENYFSFTDETNSIEGAGYTGKQPNNIMEVQRWFSSSDNVVDEDNFIYLDKVFESMVYIGFDFAEPTIDAPRRVTYSRLLERMQREVQDYGLSQDNVAAISADFIVIGNDKIYFREVDNKFLDERRLKEKEFEDRIPGYVKKRVLSFSSPPANTRTSNRSEPSPPAPSAASLNRFLGLISGLSNSSALNAISSLNSFGIDESIDRGADYWSFMDAITELNRDNAVDYGTEIESYRPLDRLPLPATEIECDGVTLQPISDTEIEDIGERFRNLQTTMPTITRNIRSVESARIPEIFPGLRPVTTGLVDPAVREVLQTNLLPRIDTIPHFESVNLSSPSLFPDAVVTMELKPANKFTAQLAKKITVGAVTSPVSKTKSMVFSSRRTSKVLGRRRGRFKISKEFTGLKVTPDKAKANKAPSLMPSRKTSRIATPNSTPGSQIPSLRAQTPRSNSTRPQSATRRLRGTSRGNNVTTSTLRTNFNRPSAGSMTRNFGPTIGGFGY